MFRHVVVRALALLALLAAVVSPPTARPSQAQLQVGWTSIPGVPNTINLTDIALVDQNTAWVSAQDGSDGLVYRLHYTGQQWQISEQNRFDFPLNALAALSDTDVWAVGEQGWIVHRDERGWQRIDSGIPTARLRTIWMQGQDGWIGGAEHSTNSALMLRYRDGRWQRESAIAGAGSIEAIQVAQGTGWAVGGGRIWRATQDRWQEQDAPAPCADAVCRAELRATHVLNPDEIWAVGQRTECDTCRPRQYAIHWVGGRWETVLPINNVIGAPAGAANWPAVLTSITFASTQSGLAVGGWVSDGPLATILRYRDGSWYAEPTPPARHALTSVAMFDNSHALAVGEGGLILSYGYAISQAPATPTPAPRPTLTPGPAQNPTRPVPNPNDPSVVYFPETGHTLRGAFRAYWVRYGGLAQFGYPLTEEFSEQSSDGRTYSVQYFERNRFEYHPENAPPYDVLLGLLGSNATSGRVGEAPFQPVAGQTIPGARFFPETGHQIAPQFLRYWEERGGLALYGYPISEPFSEVNPADGRPYLVQYFERNRFEYHPENAPPYNVLLGLLGSELLRGRGWL